MRWISVTIFYVLMFLLAGKNFAQTGPSTNDVLSFADHLYAQKDYYRAITEYKRFLFLNPSSSLVPTAEYQIGMSYMNGDKLDTAVQIFSDLADKRTKEVVGRKALLMLAESYFRMKQYCEAQYALEKFLTRYPDDLQNDAIRVKIGWYLLCQGEKELALKKFQSCPASSSVCDQAERLAKEVITYDKIPHKSPLLAGSLSAILPGTGQLYAGRFRDALLSFMINGGLIWASLEAFDRDENMAGGMFALLGASWYAGNIYNAVNSANKANRINLQNFLNNVELKCGLTLFKDESDVTIPVIAVQLSF